MKEPKYGTQNSIQFGSKDRVIREQGSGAGGTGAKETGDFSLMAQLGVDADQFSKKIQTWENRADIRFLQQSSAGPCLIMTVQNRQFFAYKNKFN